MIENLTTATPVEIDTELERLYSERFVAAAEAARLAGYLMDRAGMRFATDKARWRDERIVGTLAEAREFLAQGRKANGETLYSHQAQSAKDSIERYDAAKATVRSLDAEMAPLKAEFTRRGGWTRAYLVLNTNGHVHSSMDCSTCYEARWDDVTGEYREGTRYGWLTSLSGHDEAEIVAKAGADACTVCYPSAPVETAGARTILHHTEEEAAAAKAARDAEKAARRDAKIAKALTADGSEFVVVTDRGVHPADYYNRARAGQPFESRERFATEKAAWQWAVGKVADHRGWGYTMNEHVTEAVGQIIAAVAAKHGRTEEDVKAEFDAKVAAKIKRDRR